MEKVEMDDQKDTLEANIERLVQAGMGESAQLDSAMRTEMLTRLKSELHSKPALDFPSTALGLIAAVLAVIVYWWTVQMGSTPTWETSVIGILIGVNLLSIPIGSIVIVNRRRHV
jgi:hypothetical protein